MAVKGKKVLLAEKAKDFSVNNYSSGGAPAETLKDYSLPSDIVGSWWNKIAIYFFAKASMGDSSYDGIVLDFMKLRAFLAEQVTTHGSHVLLNHSYHRHQKK